MLLRRGLHVGPGAPALAGRNVVRAAAAVDPRLPQVPEFAALGQGSLVQASIPASVEVYARRGVLAGVLSPETSSGSSGASGLASTATAANVSAGSASASGTPSLATGIYSRVHIANHLIARLLARQPLLLQRIVATQPSTLLLGARPGRTLTVLDLDGSADWIITAPTGVQAHAGQSLNLQPRTAVSALASRSPVPFAHVLATGRGPLALESPSPLVQLRLEAGDSALVQRQHLAAFSVDSNSVGGRPQIVDLAYTLAPPPPPVARRSFGNPTVNTIVYTTVDAVKWAWRHLRALASRGNGEFVQLHGPLTALVAGRSAAVPAAAAPAPAPASSASTAAAAPAVPATATLAAPATATPAKA